MSLLVIWGVYGGIWEYGNLESGASAESKLCSGVLWLFWEMIPSEGYYFMRYAIALTLTFENGNWFRLRESIFFRFPLRVRDMFTHLVGTHHSSSVRYLRTSSSMSPR